MISTELRKADLFKHAEKLDESMRMALRRFVGKDYVENDGTVDLASISRLQDWGFVQSAETQCANSNHSLAVAYWILTALGRQVVEYFLATGGFEDQRPDDSATWL